jgi:hypothetical protein
MSGVKGAVRRPTNSRRVSQCGYPVITAVGENLESSGILNRPFSRAMKAMVTFNVQAIWSIRVPWPGGRAATTGGWASVASSAVLSLDVSGVLVALVSEAVTGFGAVIWADVVIAEMLMVRIPGCCAQP